MRAATAPSRERAAGEHALVDQLALFQGAHVPRKAARDALWRGDLDAARAQLARVAHAAEEAADAVRLERVAAGLRRAASDDPAAAVHDAFAAALAEPGPAGFLTEADWLGLYARRLAEVLAPQPARCFRGWPGAHFAFAGGLRDAAREAARRIVESEPPGPAWIEAARLAFEGGDAAVAQAWIHTACLESPDELAPEAPGLEPCGVPALDAAPEPPRLPAPVEDLFDLARNLDDLPGPRTRWVAVLGEIDRVLAPKDTAAGAPEAATEAEAAPGPDGVTPARAAPDRSGAAGAAEAGDEDPPRAFLAALRAARRSRERDHTRGPEHCSDRELRARRRMQRIAPVLLERYVQGLRGVLL